MSTIVIGPGSVTFTLRSVVPRAGSVRHSTNTGCRRATATDDDRDVRVVAVPDPDGPAVLEIDAVEGFEKGGHEMAARLLAVGDDVDSRLDLIAYGKSRTASAMPFGERITFETPRRPEQLRFREP